jgi:methylated-DNA-[protein]-cysteine S-methyltransferase
MYFSNITCGPVRLNLRCNEDALTQIHFDYGNLRPLFKNQNSHWILRLAEQQLTEFFQGQRKNFDLPISPAGTPFQQRVWRALMEVPFGAVVSYGELARRIARPTAARAVGAALGANPIVVMIPCHRVVGTNGSLTGFGGGLEMKKYLLDFEALHVPAKTSASQIVSHTL